MGTYFRSVATLFRNYFGQTCLLLSLLRRFAVGAQRPIVVKLSRERSVGLSECRSVGRSVCLSVRTCVCLVHCGKTAERIPKPFGIIGRTGPWMRQVAGFADRPTGKGTFGDQSGAHHCTNGALRHTCATVPQPSELRFGDSETVNELVRRTTLKR